MNTKRMSDLVLGIFFVFFNSKRAYILMPKNNQTLKLSQKVRHEYFFEILTYVVHLICLYSISKNQLGIRALRVFSWHYMFMLHLMVLEFSGTRPEKGSHIEISNLANFQNFWTLPCWYIGVRRKPQVTFSPKMVPFPQF